MACCFRALLPGGLLPGVDCWFCSLVWLQSVVLISYFWSLYDNLLPCLSIPDNLDFIVDDTSFALIRSTNRRLVLILSCVTPWWILEVALSGCACILGALPCILVLSWLWRNHASWVDSCNCYFCLLLALVVMRSLSCIRHIVTTWWNSTDLSNRWTLVHVSHSLETKRRGSM